MQGSSVCGINDFKIEKDPGEGGGFVMHPAFFPYFYFLSGINDFKIERDPEEGDWGGGGGGRQAPRVLSIFLLLIWNQ